LDVLLIGGVEGNAKKTDRPTHDANCPYGCPCNGREVNRYAENDNATWKGDKMLTKERWVILAV